MTDADHYRSVGEHVRLRVFWLSIVLVCAGGCGMEPQRGAPARPGGDGVLVDVEVFSGYAEVFVQYDMSGQKKYRLLHPPSGRLFPLPEPEEEGTSFASLRSLAAKIRGLKDTRVEADDPRSSTSMWIISDQRVEPLSAGEIAELRSLLAEDPGASRAPEAR